MTKYMPSRLVYEQLKANNPHLPDGTNVERVELILEPGDVARLVITSVVTDDVANALTTYALTELAPFPPQTQGDDPPP